MFFQNVDLGIFGSSLRSSCHPWVRRDSSNLMFPFSAPAHPTGGFAAWRPPHIFLGHLVPLRRRAGSGGQDWSARAVQHQGLCKVIGTNHKMNGLIQVGSLGVQYQEMGFQHEFHSEDGD